MEVSPKFQNLAISWNCCGSWEFYFSPLALFCICGPTEFIPKKFSFCGPGQRARDPVLQGPDKSSRKLIKASPKGKVSRVFKVTKRVDERQDGPMKMLRWNIKLFNTVYQNVDCRTCTTIQQLCTWTTAYCIVLMWGLFNYSILLDWLFVAFNNTPIDAVWTFSSPNKYNFSKYVKKYLK